VSRTPASLAWHPSFLSSLIQTQTTQTMQATNMFRTSLRRSLVNNARSNAKNFALKGRAPAGRAYSTPPPPPAGKSNTGLYVGLGLAVVAAGAGYYVFASSDPTAREVATALKSGAQSAKSYAHYTPKKEDYQEVYNKIAKVIDEAGEYDGKEPSFHFFRVPENTKSSQDGSYGPVLVRLAWHSSGTYDKETKTGGRCDGFLGTRTKLLIGHQQLRDNAIRA
jgi:cytochrome c peroxidase